MPNFDAIVLHETQQRIDLDTQIVYNVGDVMYDSIFFNKSLAEKKSNVLDRLDLHDQSEEVCKYCLATIHRAENTDLSQNLEGILKALNQIAKTGMSVVLPLHPRTRAKIKEFELGAKLKFSTNATQSPSNPTNKDRLCERSEPQSYPVVGQARCICIFCI